LRLRFLHVGVRNPKCLEERLADYDQRLSRFFKTERSLVKSSQFERDKSDIKLAKEEAAILKAIDPSFGLVLLDENGTEIKNSRQFSENLQKLLSRHQGQLCFLIGGSFGVSDAVRKKAHSIWRLSNLTMNHHLAQLVLAEQIYRGVTIWKGLPYHND